MQYDFTKMPTRPVEESPKWRDMLRFCPGLPSDVAPLSVADMEFCMAPEIIEGLTAYLKETVLGYSVDTKAYRDAVCGWMARRHGWKADPNWMICCEGVVPALYIAVQAFTQPGDGVLVLTPVYAPFYDAIRRNGRKVVCSPLLYENSSYTIDFEGLACLARNPQTKLLLFCSPHNPVGRVWTQEELNRVVQICLENDVLVVSDEIHSDLVFSPHRHTVFANLSEAARDSCVVCTAPSKTFNIAGMHVANVFIPSEKLRNRFKTALDTTGFYSLGTLAYKACELAYTRCDAWYEELLCVLQENRDFAAEFLKKNLPKVKMISMEGTYLMWLDLRAYGLETKEQESLMKNEAKLFLNEGYTFGEEGAGFERINIACPKKVLEKSLQRLYNALSLL